MDKNELAEALLKRRQELEDQMLKKADISLEKQHQIFGAINEIDLFLQIVNYYDTPNNNSVRLIKPIYDDKNFLTKMFQTIKKK